MQALNLKELYHITSHDLNTLHEKIDLYKETFGKNEHLLGNFSAERIHEISTMKNEIQNFTKESNNKLDSMKQAEGGQKIII